MDKINYVLQICNTVSVRMHPTYFLIYFCSKVFEYVNIYGRQSKQQRRFVISLLSSKHSFLMPLGMKTKHFRNGYTKNYICSKELKNPNVFLPYNSNYYGFIASPDPENDHVNSILSNLKFSKPQN